MKLNGIPALALLSLSSTATALAVRSIENNAATNSRFTIELDQLEPLTSDQSKFFANQNDTVTNGQWLNVLNTTGLNETRILVGVTPLENEALFFSFNGTSVQTHINNITYNLYLPPPATGVEMGVITLNTTAATKFTNDNLTLVPQDQSQPEFNGFNVCFGTTLPQGEMFFNATASDQPSINCISVSLNAAKNPVTEE